MMKQFLEEAAEQFDWVVLDTPPVALLSDANLLAAMIDLAILVVGANSTPYPLVRRAVEAIGASKILGVVLNRAERSEFSSGYGYYYGYSYSYRRTAPPKKRWALAVSDGGAEDAECSSRPGGPSSSSLGETSLLVAAVAAGTYLRLGDYGWDLLWTQDGFLKALLIVGGLPDLPALHRPVRPARHRQRRRSADAPASRRSARRR